MATNQHPLQAVVDACTPLKFAPLPDIRTSGFPASYDQPVAERWYRADLMAAEGAVGELFDRAAQQSSQHKLPAATRFLRALLREPIFYVSAGLYRTGRAPLVDAQQLWFPWMPDATFGTPTVTSATIAVLATDPAAEHPDALVVGEENAALEQAAAQHMVSAFSPIIDAVHAHTRVGMRTLWGWVLDTAHFYMLNPARYLCHDAEEAWERAHRLGEELIRAGARTRSRPRLFPFCENHPQGTWAVRGTCCFAYKDDAEHGVCTTCPLKPDSDRRAELQEWIRDPALAP